MAARLQELAALVDEKYDGDVTRLWTEPKTGTALFAPACRSFPASASRSRRSSSRCSPSSWTSSRAGWTKVTGDYGLKGYRSVADVVDAESLQKVRDFKKQQKASKAAAG